MVSSRRQSATCPVCNRSDQVKTLRLAYGTHDISFGPPPMPESQASMMKYLTFGMVLVGVCVFFIILTLSGTGSGFSWWQMGITLTCIIAALLLSIAAIRHIGQGDEAARRLYPAWDKAMANWQRLQYCARDKVFFDPQTSKTLSESAVHTQLAVVGDVNTSTPQTAVASH